MDSDAGSADFYKKYLEIQEQLNKEEQARQKAEAARKEAEEARQKAEAARQEAEEARQKAEEQAAQRQRDLEKSEEARQKAEAQIAEVQANNSSTKKPPGHSRSPSQTNAILRALQKDWKNTYFPHSLIALRDLVRQYQLLDMNEYYAKTLVFIQSSGMGKSRLADAFGQSCPMINFILRDYGTAGFPPSDEEILSFLREHPPSNIPEPTSEDGESRKASDDFLMKRAAVAWNHTLATALLQASFEIFNTWVESKPFTTMTLEQLAFTRHAEMAPLEPDTDAQHARSQRTKMRIEFCNSVAQRARVLAKELISNPAWVEKFDNDAPSSVHHQLEMEHSEEKPNPMNSLYNAAGNLMKILQQCQDASNVDSLLVLVFDEASSLMTVRPSAEPQPGLYVALNRVISCLKKSRMWSFFLSTESLIGQLVPPSNVTRTGNYLEDSSARLVLGKTNTPLKRFPPFVGLQLDVEDRRRMQNPKLREEELLKPLEKFAKLEHMALFGRPLWYAYAGQDENMLDLAKLKLIGGRQYGCYDATNPNHVFATLSFRLSLDVCLQNPSTIPLARTAVNSFMRVVISMDHETGTMDTLAPSEPVLARAAMEHLCSEKNWSKSIQTLSVELLEKGLIEKGRKGELYARFVLILAHDWNRWIHRLQTGPVLVFAPTFSVSDFLKALYAEDHHESIRKLPGRIQKAKMNFNHFVPAYENLTAEVIPALCHDLLRRSAAMQLAWQQETYDLLIPVYYGEDNEKFDPSKCGVILVQVKNKDNATTVTKIFDEDFINVSPKTSSPANLKVKNSKRKPEKFVFNEMAHPILFLLFDLGVVRGSRASAPPVQLMHSNSGLQPDLWAIHSRGHDETIFGCLSHMEDKSSSERFFASIQTGKTLAEELSVRNRTFYKVRRDFRYKGFSLGGGASAGGSEARVQEDDVAEGGEKSGVGEAEEDGGVGEGGEDSGVVDTRAQEGSASNTISRERKRKWKGQS